MKVSLPEVNFSDWGDVRYLHLGTEWVQGSMKLDAPFDIELEYVQRMMAWLLFAFAAVALVMAAAGLYGVIAYTVTQRTQEIGVRMALGADPRSVVRLVAAEGLRLTIAGMITGTLAAAAVSRAMRGMLFDVSPADPLTYAVVLALFAATACAALIVPARRALRVRF